MAKVRRKREAAGAQVEERDNRALWLGGLLLVLLLAVGAIILIGRGTGGADIDTAIYEGVPGEGLVLGDPDAPVVVREFIDFKCPHCRTAAETIVPQVVEDYVQAGDVRFEFIPIAFNEQSLPGAEAALCAAEQDMFIEYHEVLFANQRNTFNITNLTNYASQVGLDEQQFRACLTAGQFRPQVQENLREFQQLGASSTPTFFVNDTQVVGAVPYEEMQAAIEAELEEAS